MSTFFVRARRLFYILDYPFSLQRFSLTNGLVDRHSLMRKTMKYNSRYNITNPPIPLPLTHTTQSICYYVGGRHFVSIEGKLHVCNVSSFYQYNFSRFYILCFLFHMARVLTENQLYHDSIFSSSNIAFAVPHKY